jgi:hypothetical protein
MYKPLTGESEWVELYNRGDTTINLLGWNFSDSHILEMMPLPNFIMSANSYLVLAQDSTIYNFDIPFTSPVVIFSDWNYLNNDGDTLYLFNNLAEIADFLPYPNDWGNIENGISMERINPLGVSSNLENWSPCLDPLGATPGRQNSVYFTSSMNYGIKLSVDPEVFTPDGDGIDDVANITYELPVATARVSIRIFDVHGRLIRFLVEGEMSSHQGTFSWDGTNEEGKISRLGPYIIHLQAISELEKSEFEAKKVVILGGKL